MSRFITKVRWVVKSVHGVLKQKYRLLDHKIDIKLIPKIGIYFRITSFLNNFRRKLPFRSVTSNDILDFPEMTERDLKILFTGSYRLSEAVSYLAEVMD